MMILLLVGFLIGMVLGQDFKVLVLAPLFVLALVLTIGVGVAHADTVWSIVLTAATVAIGMQLGYFFGLGLRLVLVAALARLHLSVPAAPTSARHPTR